MTIETKLPAQFCEYAITRFYRGSKVIGAGFLVEGGYILTCAHVVKQALGAEKAQSPVGQIVKINFPYVSLRQKLDAEVLFYQLEDGDEAVNVDIAGLQVLEPLPAQASPGKMLASYAEGNDFGVLGFPKGRSKGVMAYGKLRYQLPSGWVQMEDIKDQGYAIQPGFSGSPVWAKATKAIVGMTVARDQANQDAKVGFMVPARSLLTVQRQLASISLFKLLIAAEDNLKESIQVAYQQCCPAGWNKPEPADLSAKLDLLLTMKAEPGKAKPIERFAAFLTLPELNDELSLRKDIQEWVEARVDSFEALQQQVSAQLANWRTERNQATESVLRIHVEPELSDRDDHFVSAAYIRDVNQYDYRTEKGSERVQAPAQSAFNERVSLENLNLLILACLDEVVKKSPNDLTIYLILPVAWLSEPFDHLHLPNPLPGLSLPNVRVGTRYRLIVGIAERLTPQLMDYYGEPWKKRWRDLQKLTTGQKVCKAFLLADHIATQQDLYSALNEAHVTGLKLTKRCEPARYNEIFSTLIATGTPAAVWLRYDQFAGDVVALEQVDALLACKIATLLEVVRQARTDAIGNDEDAHIGHHLSFLWENPELSPAPKQRLQIA